MSEMLTDGLLREVVAYVDAPTLWRLGQCTVQWRRVACDEKWWGPKVLTFMKAFGTVAGNDLNAVENYSWRQRYARVVRLLGKVKKVLGDYEVETSVMFLIPGCCSKKEKGFDPRLAAEIANKVVPKAIGERPLRLKKVSGGDPEQDVLEALCSLVPSTFLAPFRRLLVTSQPTSFFTAATTFAIDLPDDTGIETSHDVTLFHCVTSDYVITLTLFDSCYEGRFVTPNIHKLQKP